MLTTETSSTALDRYRFGAVEVRSDVPLPGYREYWTAAGRSRILVNVRRDTDPPAPGHLLGRHKGRSGLLEIRETADRGRVVVAEGLTAFTITADGAVRWHLPGSRDPGVDDADFLVSSIVPWAVATEPGTAVVHAACLATSRGAVLLCGPSGVGKSTLSTALHQDLGWHLLGDDAALIRVDNGLPVALSCSREVRLWADSGELLGMGAGVLLPRYQSKSRHPVAGPADKPVEVGFVVRLLDPDTDSLAEPPGVRHAVPSPTDGVRMTRLRAGDGIAMLRLRLMRLPSTSITETARDFTLLTAWGRRIAFSTLCYPRTADALPAAVQAIAHLISEAERRPLTSELRISATGRSS
ncbi:AAA domain-containing protein [Parafrankia irregularis]|uniref:AAA domain-containing protein n=1 Tax=Parafrankia irregularis TaxID=795642 RepID=A0A0S4QXA5_9ACTN|nr:MULTISPECIES: hypothetical protein [Parafrankia]MBE3206502.1 hypothetical protein [Parafrankia sp. CH37]CUU59956.1 AAA domain-containing protein [Parafrankia irregularis]